jgi:hypothetical protein
MIINLRDKFEKRSLAPCVMAFKCLRSFNTIFVVEKIDYH